MSHPNPKSRPAMTALAFTLILLTATGALAQHYTRTDLTANRSGISSAPNIDPNLVNAWGVGRSQTSPWWISDNGTGLSTLYDGTGLPQGLVVTIPLPDQHTGTSAPTGMVFNPYNDSFELVHGQRSIFLFVTEDGTIAGWNPNVNLTNAVIKVNDSEEGAVYKGCAIAKTEDGARLYVTNFTTGAVDVYNSKFQEIEVTGGFKDSRLPKNYAAFGIQNVGGNIVVTFAQREPGSKDENHGAGLGFVDVFDTNGKLLLRLQHNKTLNAPWGIAQAPGDFGSFSHRLLIGNFGDGFINAYNAVSGKREGTLLDVQGAPIHIDGLWALSFGGNSAGSGSATDLFFTAGPNGENDGLFGKLQSVASDQRGNSE